MVTVKPVTSPDRWKPDEQLVPAILAGSGRKMSQLQTPDRCWAVAGLTLAGLTAEEIADRMDCSLRLVRSIRAEDMTQVCTYSQRESRTFTDEIRMAHSELTQQSQFIGELKGELERTKGKLDRLIDAHIVGAKPCGRCGSPMGGYNLYVHPKSGKHFCRSCRRDRQQEYRDGRKKSLAGLPFDVAGTYRSVYC